MRGLMEGKGDEGWGNGGSGVKGELLFNPWVARNKTITYLLTYLLTREMARRALRDIYQDFSWLSCSFLAPSFQYAVKRVPGGYEGLQGCLAGDTHLRGGYEGL